MYPPKTTLPQAVLWHSMQRQLLPTYPATGKVCASLQRCAEGTHSLSRCFQKCVLVIHFQLQDQELTELGHFQSLEIFLLALQPASLAISADLSFTKREL